MKKRAWVHDAETLINCFVVVFRDRDSDERKIFIIHDLRDDREPLYRFLHEEVEELIGYNSLDFDSKVLQFILERYETLLYWDARDIYRFAQEIIAEKGYRKGLQIPHRDLYRLHHFDNVARATSLKWLQCHLGMENIQDMPIDHDQVITTWEQLETICKYCDNDVDTTKALLFHPKTQELIQVRDEMEAEYKIPCRNLSNASMGERILLDFIPGAMETIPLTPDAFKLEKVIQPYIRFRTPEFQRVLDKMKKVVITPGDDDREPFTFNTVFGGMKYTFGLGGLHAARPKTYWNDVWTMDVTSYYPRFAIENQISPRHLGPRFTVGYDRLFQTRTTFPKGTNKNKALKEALNAAFGKSNSEYSKLYDPVMTFAITVNGQLLLAMLCEAIERLSAGKVVMANTDGIEVIPENVALLQEIMNAWQKMTRLKLETDIYSHMLIRDVNNYIAKSSLTGKLKQKGAYEVEKELHKDPSARIVPTVIADWFKDDCSYPVRHYYPPHMHKHDLFFMFARAKTGKFVAVSKDGMDTVELPKTIRYIITETGYVLRKKTDKKSEKMHSKEYISLFNNLTTLGMDEIPINHEWYMREITSLTEFGVAKPSLF